MKTFLEFVTPAQKVVARQQAARQSAHNNVQRSRLNDYNKSVQTYKHKVNQGFPGAVAPKPPSGL